MKVKIKLQVHLESLSDPYSREKGLAKICVEIEEKYFPEKDWNDFLFFILPDWSHALIEMLKCEREEVILGFADGQYAIKLIKHSNENYIAQFGIWDQFDNSFESEFSKKIDFWYFCNELEKVNKQVINYMESLNYQSKYFKAVKEWGNKLSPLL